MNDSYAYPIGFNGRCNPFRPLRVENFEFVEKARRASFRSGTMVGKRKKFYFLLSSSA